MDTHAFDPVRTSTDTELRAHSRWLAGVARALIGEGGDDLAQDAWVAALERKPDAERGLKPWLAGALRFLASNERRTRARRATRERAAAHDEALPASDTLAAEIELQRLIADAVSALDEPERSTLVRRYWHGESAAEIARRDGVPAGTVRARLSRALAKLREQLDKRFEGKRNAWCALLTPLAQRDAGVGTGVAVAAAGVWTMSVFVKLASVAAAVALAWLLWNVESSGADAPRALAQSAVVSPPELTEPAHDVASPDAATSSRTPAAAPAAAQAAMTEHASTVVRAHIVDERGGPIAGAELVHELADLTASARSDHDGRVLLALDLPELVDTELTIQAPARTRAEIWTRLASGRELDLGDVVLYGAGTIRGRMVDTEGRPIAGLARAALPELSIDPRTDAHDGPPAGTRLVAASAGADGRFVLEAVRAGACRAWCGSAGARWNYTQVLSVRAGESLDAGDIVLQKLDSTIAGRVEGPDGRALAHQVVVAMEPGTLGSETSALTDVHGAFVLELAHEGTFDLWIEDAFGGTCADVVRGVARGTRDVVLRAQHGAFIDVVVRDALGAPVPKYEIRVGLEHGRVLSSKSTCANDGRTRVSVWPVPFWISIAADGHAPEERGPFERSSAGTVVEFTLRAAASVRGRVTRHGVPLRDVTVSLRELARPENARAANGFPYAFVSSPSSHEVRTAADGAFTLSACTSGRFVVLASSNESPSGQSRVLELDGRTSIDGLELALDATGTLEGRALAKDSGTSAWIGISHGDGWTLVARTAGDGSFRFTALAPGRWWIRKLERDLTGEITIQPYDEGWREPQSFVIEDGRTTHVEIDLEREPRIAGRLRFGAIGLGVWTAALQTEPVLQNSRQVVVLDTQGEFALTLGRHGPALLTLADAETNGVRHEIRAGVELEPGVQTITFDYADATVRGTAPRCAGRTLAFVLRDGEKRAFVTRVAVAADGRFGPARTCAGKLMVVDVTPEGQLAGERLLEFDLAAGSERELEVP